MGHVVKNAIRAIKISCPQCDIRGKGPPHRDKGQKPHVWFTERLMSCMLFVVITSRLLQVNYYLIVRRSDCFSDSCPVKKGPSDRWWSVTLMLMCLKPEAERSRSSSKASVTVQKPLGLCFCGLRSEAEAVGRTGSSPTRLCKPPHTVLLFSLHWCEYCI